MPVTTVGQAVLTFGTKDFDHTTYGKAENISRKPVAKKTEITDGEDNVTGLVFTDPDIEVTADFTPLAGATLATEDIIGAEATIGDDSIIVEDAEEKYAAGKAMTFNIKGRTRPNIVRETPST